MAVNEAIDARQLLVNVFAMADGHDQHQQLLVFDLAQNPVIADPVTPQPGQVCFESLSEAARIGVARNPFVEIADDVPLR